MNRSGNIKRLRAIAICGFMALFVLVLNGNVQGQRIEKSSGKAQVRMELDMTTEEAYEEARLQAMIDAIQNAFGTYVEQQTDMTIIDGKEAYNIIGGTKVRGDWIETLDEDFREEFRVETTKLGKQNMKYITCNIKGKVRKTIPKADIEYVALNCPDVVCRTTNFYNDEQLYMYFKSPVDGYLSVYIEVDNITYRLLPYTTMIDEQQNGVKVRADQDYIFFSEEYNTFRNMPVDELEMFTNKKLEYNTLYVIFSEEAFVKPVLDPKEEVNGRIMPKSIESTKFRGWLSNNRAALPSFQEKKITVSIKPN
jgi:hypothetical protein